MRDFFSRHREIILYIIFGALTTLTNFIAFWLFGFMLGDGLYLVTNVIAWLVSVIFAYFTNKLFVFESKSFAPRVLLPEIGEFFGARMFSFLLEEFGLWLLVDILSFGELELSVLGLSVGGQMIAKVILAVIVVITNYVISKFLIFKNNKSKEQ